jgi:hypothetical protein
LPIAIAAAIGQLSACTRAEDCGQENPPGDRGKQLKKREIRVA